jgi:hypothetical protein
VGQGFRPAAELPLGVHEFQQLRVTFEIDVLSNLNTPALTWDVH